MAKSRFFKVGRSEKRFSRDKGYYKRGAKKRAQKRATKLRAEGYRTRTTFSGAGDYLVWKRKK